MPEVSESHERFTVPETKSYIEGKTTVFENFVEIADVARRDKDHLMKFLLGNSVLQARSMATGQYLTENLKAP